MPVRRLSWESALTPRLPSAEGEASVRAATRRRLLLAATCVVIFTAAIVPVSHYQLDSTTSFVPAMLAVVACFDLMSVCLLVGDYRDRGDIRLLVMALAYSWSLVLMGGYALAFPGAVSADPPLAATASMAPYFYISWHAGFPLLLGLAWAPWPERWTARTPRRWRVGTAAVALVGSVVTGLSLITLLYMSADSLPVLIEGLDTSRMTSVTAPIALPIVIAALVATAFGTRNRYGPERWATIAVLVCLCDLVLTYSASTRYSLGWYCGRSLTLLAAGVVLLAMLAAFQRVKARAETEAATDQLTGLQNRRSAYESLEQVVARSRRSGAELGVLTLDLDYFKRVNDRFGHEAGDVVLQQIAYLLMSCSRRGDIVARVGGEEFLMILPDTGRSGTAIAAEKVRAVIAASPMVPAELTMTVSVGAANLQHDDSDIAAVVKRSDNALYQAKAAGRNRVVMAAAPRESALLR